MYLLTSLIKSNTFAASSSTACICIITRTAVNSIIIAISELKYYETARRTHIVKNLLMSTVSKTHINIKCMTKISSKIKPALDILFGIKSAI